jgi:hypothetical protein
VLYIPLALIGGAWFIRDRLVAPGVIVEAIVIAVSYQVWSVWKHRRHTLAVSRD